MKPISRDELQSILSAHREWARSGGASGTRADLAGADLAGAKGVDASANTKPIDYAARAARYRSQNPDVPVVDRLDARILSILESGEGAIDMSQWHSPTCATTHCRAGWSITLAGDAGRALEGN